HSSLPYTRRLACVSHQPLAANRRRRPKNPTVAHQASVDCRRLEFKWHRLYHLRPQIVAVIYKTCHPHTAGHYPGRCVNLSGVAILRSHFDVNVQRMSQIGNRIDLPFWLRGAIEPTGDDRFMDPQYLSEALKHKA